MCTITKVDNEQREELVKEYYKLDFSKLARLAIADISSHDQGGIFFSSFPKDRVVSALQDPQKNEKLLRDLSNFLYVISPHYRRLCNYYAEMPTFDYYIEPYKLDITRINMKTFKKAYRNALWLVENMNIKHEMLRAFQILFREGVFYGYEHSTDDSYFIQKLDPDYCRISGVEDGVFVFEFDFGYFEFDEDRLENYAPEFHTMYNKYKNSKRARGKRREDLQWQEIPSDRSICLKVDESILSPFPPFVGVLLDIYEIEDYKKLKKAKSEMQNIAIISGTVPINEKSDRANDFKIDLDTAIAFGNKIIEQLPEQIGFILSVYDDLKLFKLDDDKVGTDKVEEATKNFWSAAGVSKNLFADNSNTDVALKQSIISDEQAVFSILRQVERWVNRKLKFDNSKYKFKINILDITRFNQAEKVAKELKAAQFGLPNKIRLFTSMGNSQSSIETMNFLENEVLELPTGFIPLQSSHTQGSGDVNSPTQGEKGRPPSGDNATRTDEGAGDNIDDGGDKE